VSAGVEAHAPASGRKRRIIHDLGATATPLTKLPNEAGSEIDIRTPLSE
jgi:hypothetical protein